jgi:hypothetical protein
MDDFWRVLVCSQAAFAAGLGLYIFIHYAIYDLTPKILRRHISAISLSYCILSGMVAWEVASRFNDPISFRTPLAFVGFALGDYGLASILVHVYRRTKRE